MRITEAQTLSGYFWLPATPEEKIAGTLEISDGGKVELEVIGNFDESIENFSKLSPIQRIHGEVEKLGSVTLDDCFYTRKSISVGVPSMPRSALGGVNKSSLFCGRLFAGAQFNPAEVPQFEEVLFRVEGLDEWLGKTGIESSWDPENHVYSLSLKTWTLPEIELEDDLKLEFVTGNTLPGAPLLTEATIRHWVSIKITAAELRPLDDFVSLIYKITTFLGFAVDKVVSIRPFKASVTIPENERREKGPTKNGVTVYYRSTPFSQTKPKVEWHNLLFGYGNMGSDPPLIIRAWLTNYESLRSSLDLYFAAISDSTHFLESKFLLFAQAMETWHRRESDIVEMDPEEFDSIREALLDSCPEERKDWLRARLAFANEVSLARRLKDLLSPFEPYLPGGLKLKRVIRDIVDTRNYLTHYNPALESRAAGGGDFYQLVDRMECLFKLLLLERIGFSQEKIADLVESNSDFQSKIGSS